jgi:3-dehydroquinate synthase
VKLEVVLASDREQAKRLSTIERLAEKLLARGADRTSVLAAMGGGVLGDITGFLAATYMRGIPYLQLPTTLVAQVDSSVGGKTGVNLRTGKNLVGAFHPPRAVLVDLRALRSLSPRDYRAGLYEALKTAVIADAALFHFFEQNTRRLLAREPAAVQRLVVGCLRGKAAIVSEDEYERQGRVRLNFGHTFGHALETVSRYRLRHGEAVGWGMIGATLLADHLGHIRSAEAERIIAGVRSLGSLPRVPRVSPARVYAQLFADKKTRRGGLRFILPRRVGRVEMVADVPRAAVLATVRTLLGARGRR